MTIQASNSRKSAAKRTIARAMYLMLSSLAAMGTLTGVAQAADCVTVSTATAKAIQLRSTPSAASPSSGTLAPDKYLPLTAAVPNWYQLSLPDGRSAFATKRTTEIKSCPPGVEATTTPPGSVTASGEIVFELHAIDVGTGLAVLLRGPDFAVLYDAGSNDDLGLGAKNRAIAYLETLKPALVKLDHVILSHPHRDHVELLPDVITKYKPTNVWNSGAYNGICGYRNFLRAIAAEPAIQYHTVTLDSGTESVPMTKKTCYGVAQEQQILEIQHAKRIDNEKIVLGQDAAMTILYANGAHQSSFNENSLVVRFDLGNKRILVMGDGEAGGRKAPSNVPANGSVEGTLLACCTSDLKADVLVVAHHGSKTSSRIKTLNDIGAKLFVVSAGPTKYASVVLPDAEIVDELTKRGTLFRTDLEDDQCGDSEDKVGTTADGKPGGCDNVRLLIPRQSAITAEYWHPN